MADWFDIPDTSIDPDAPLTSELAYAWRDNPIAIAEGAPGAPRIAIGALQRISAGGKIRSRYDAERVSSNALVSFAFMQAGSIRVTFQHRSSNSSGTAYVTRKRRDTETDVGSWSNSGSYVTRTIDVPVLPGDLITVRNDGGSGMPYIGNVRFMTNGEDLYPGSYASLEGNTYA